MNRINDEIMTIKIIAFYTGIVNHIITIFLMKITNFTGNIFESQKMNYKMRKDQTMVQILFR